MQNDPELAWAAQACPRCNNPPAPAPHRCPSNLDPDSMATCRCCDECTIRCEIGA